MSYAQALQDQISTYISFIKMLLFNSVVAFLTAYGLTNGFFHVFRKINRILWKRGTEAEEREEEIEYQRRRQTLNEWSHADVERRKEDEKRHDEDEVCRSASTLRRRIRLRVVEEENIANSAKRLAQEEEFERLSQKLAKTRDKEEQLQSERKKLSKRIARKTEELEELKYERQRLLQKIEAMAAFHEQSWEGKLKEAVRKDEEELKRNQEILGKGNERSVALENQEMAAFYEQSWEGMLKAAARKDEEEELKRNKEILDRGNERRVALEKQRRTAAENQENAAKEERRQEPEVDYGRNAYDREELQFETSDTEQDLELGLNSIAII